MIDPKPGDVYLRECYGDLITVIRYLDEGYGNHIFRVSNNQDASMNTASSWFLYNHCTLVHSFSADWEQILNG